MAWEYPPQGSGTMNFGDGWERRRWTSSRSTLEFSRCSSSTVLQRRRADHREQNLETLSGVGLVVLFNNVQELVVEFHTFSTCSRSFHVKIWTFFQRAPCIWQSRPGVHAYRLGDNWKNLGPLDGQQL